MAMEQGLKANLLIVREFLDLVLAAEVLMGIPSHQQLMLESLQKNSQIYKIHIKQDAFTHTAFAGSPATGSQREASFFIGSPRRDSILTRALITIVGPTHPDTRTQYPKNTIAYIKLSSSATTTRAAVDQIVDGLNSFDGNDNFSNAPFVFKDVARAKASPDKRTIIIEMFQSYQDSIIPQDTNFGNK